MLFLWNNKTMNNVNIKTSFHCCLLFNILQLSNPQLLINVKNQGGDIVQETIIANVSDDIVSLEFLRPDGIFITQTIDFTNEVQILKVIVPAEEERGQTQYQVMCYLLHADKADFIGPDAIIKLRQKNPGTIRLAEDDRGTSSIAMTMWVDLRRSGELSPQVPLQCREAKDAVYSRKEDVGKWANRPGMPNSWLLSAVTPFPEGAMSNDESNNVFEPTATSVPRCAGLRTARLPCICHFESCISWYPCGLKYCKGKPQPNVPSQNLSYRCGIKTCRKCQRFEYYVHRKMHCVWDE